LTERWREALNEDPVDWLLETADPAVRHLALVDLLDEPADSNRARRARAAAMRTGPMAAILDHQEGDGFWVKPGAGYGPKYTGTVWSLMFLEQMGADPRDRRVRAACRYVLDHTQAPNGGFGWSGVNSAVVHCLNGNVLRALVVFGFLDDPGVRSSIDWQVGAITGDDPPRWHPSTTSGPGFECGINGQLPCAWGAVKALRGLAAIPPRRRSKPVRRAIDDGVTFLLSRDLAVADYPTDTRISPNWHRFGFPSGYVADALQAVEVLAELGRAKDPRLTNILDMLIRKQDAHGMWRNEHPYRGKLWAEIDPPRSPSKWVTLRACRVLKAALG
jgi:hypothetical protein